jgi:hypothetical protein
VESRGAAPTLQGAREAGFAYQFALDNGPAGCQFVYETPALIVESQVAYELKNIELP